MRRSGGCGGEQRVTVSVKAAKEAWLTSQRHTRQPRNKLWLGTLYPVAPQTNSTHVFFCTPAVFCFCSAPSAQFYPASFSCTERKPLGHCFSSFLFLQPPPLLNYSIRSFRPANTHTHIPYAATCQAT